MEDCKREIGEMEDNGEEEWIIKERREDGGKERKEDERNNIKIAF